MIHIGTESYQNVTPLATPHTQELTLSAERSETVEEPDETGSLYNVSLLGPQYLYDHLGIGITYIVLVTTFIAVGTFGNVLVITAVAIHRKLRTVGNMFIVNLALADLCVTGFVDPFAIVGFVLGEAYFIKRPVLCEFIASICLTSCFCSLLSIGAISVNRYIHICYSGKYDAIFTKNKTVIMTVCVWIVSFLLEMGCFIGWGDHVYDRKTMSCIYDRTADYSFTLFFACVGVGSPLLVIFLCYIHIYFYVRQSKKRIQDGFMTRTSTPKASEMRFVKTILLIVIIFMSCWVPYVTVILYDRYDLLSPAIHTFSVTVAHMSSSLNFILYGVTNRYFREAYFQVMYHIDIRRLWRTTNADRHNTMKNDDDNTYNLSVTNIDNVQLNAIARNTSSKQFF